MAELAIQFRCLNDCLGYCAANKHGMQVSSPNGAVSYVGFGAVCEEDYLVCKDHVKFTDIVKPDAPKMEEPAEKPAKKRKVKADANLP